MIIWLGIIVLIGLVLGTLYLVARLADDEMPITPDERRDNDGET